MKTFFKNLFKAPMLLVFLLVVLVFGLPALVQSAEINRYAVVTVVGLDPAQEEGKIKVSLLTFTPIAEQTFTENYKVITAQARSVSEALDYAGLHIGRQVGLSHTKTVIINKDLIGDDVGKHLDYLARNKLLGAEARLVVTDSDTEELLDAVQKLDSESSIKISDVIEYSGDYIYSIDSTFKSFFKGIFGPTKVGVMPIISLSKSEPGLSVSGGSNSDLEKGSTTGEGESTEIVDNGETVVFKNGKYKTILNGLDVKKINLMKRDSAIGSLVLNNYTGGDYRNSKLTFEILEKKQSRKVYFQNDIPVVVLNLNVTVSLAEVQDENGIVKKNVEFTGIDDNLKKAVELELKKLISEGIEIMRDNQTDIVDFYTTLSNSNRGAFNKFLNSLEDKEDYLNGIVFKVGINVFSR